MNVVLFLGAGFSKAFGLPVMAEFNEYARELRGMMSEQHALTEVIQQARQAHAFLRTHPFNIEDILTMAEMQHRLGLADEQRATAIKKLIHAVYAKPISWEAVDELARRFALLLNVSGTNTPYAALRQSHGAGQAAPDFEGLSIITTNYDLNVETVLLALGHRADVGKDLTDQREHSGIHIPEAKTVRVHKLHGSVDWIEQLRGDGSRTVVARARFRQRHHPNGGKAAITAEEILFGSNETPHIIPPSFLKPDLSSPLRKTWSRAAQDLRQADVIVFIGYSFPASDREMASFLATSLWDNTRLNRILIVDPHADSICETLRHKGYGDHFLQLLIPVQGPWQSQNQPAFEFSWGNGP